MSVSKNKLHGKIALVTGASKGIGASIAKHLAGEGAFVVINYSSSKTGADKVVADIAALGGQAVAIQGDVSKPDDVTRLLADVRKAAGRLDILVNNAGVYEFGALDAITPGHFHRQFDINVLGLLLTTQAAVTLFPESGGSIINISSVISRVTPPATAVYTATKGAVDAISSVLAKELGPRKIRVNTISPGMVETEGAHTAGIIGSDMQRDVIAQTPLGRTGQPQDIGPAAVFLASEDSAWITGETLVIAGGLR